MYSMVIVHAPRLRDSNTKVRQNTEKTVTI